MCQKKESPVIRLSDDDCVGIYFPYSDALVVTLMTANHNVHRILVDNWSSTDILYWLIFEKLKLGREKIVLVHFLLMGFTGEQVQPLGLIELPVIAKECEEAFNQFKRYLRSPLLLSRAIGGEILFLYLTVSPSVVNLVLIREDQGVKKPIYFTSRALHGAKEWYPQIEKLALALIVSTRRLRPHFQVHTVRVLTEYPLKKILQKPKISRRLMNWAVELGEFDIDFLQWTTIKRRALANFLAKLNGFPKEVGLPVGET
jgi:hypothetical protein